MEMNVQEKFEKAVKIRESMLAEGHDLKQIKWLCGKVYRFAAAEIKGTPVNEILTPKVRKAKSRQETQPEAPLLDESES